MKKTILSYLLLIISLVSNAVSHDLDYYLNQAYCNSPLIYQLKNESSMIRLNYVQIEKILQKPKVTLDAQILFSPIIVHDTPQSKLAMVSNGANNYVGYDQATTDGGQYHSTINVEQTLFNKNKMATYAKQNEIEIKQAEHALKLNEFEINQVVTYQYLHCYALKLQLANQKEGLGYFQDQITNIEQLVAHSLVKQSDLMLVKIEYLNARIEFESTVNEYHQSINDLNVLCGINDTTEVEIADLTLPMNVSNLKTSAFTKSFELDSIHVINNLNIYNLQYKPELSWFANAGMNAVYLPSLNRFGLSAGLSLKWNLYDGHQRETEAEKAAIALDNLSFAKQQKKNEVALQRHLILNNLLKLKTQQALMQEQLNQYDELLKMVHLEMESGVGSVLELKTIYSDLLVLKQKMADLKIKHEQFINAYNYWSN